MAICRALGEDRRSRLTARQRRLARTFARRARPRHVALRQAIRSLEALSQGDLGVEADLLAGLGASRCGCARSVAWLRGA